MAWTLLAHTAAGSVLGLPVTTSDIDTTGADLIVAVVSDYALGLPIDTVTDNQTNSYLRDVSRTDGTICRCGIWSLFNPITSTTHNFSYGPGGGGYYPTICVMAWSGSGSVNQSSGGHTSSLSAVTSLNTNPGFTFGVSNLLSVAGLNVNGSESGGNAPSIDSSFTISDTIDYVASNHFLGSAAYFVNSGSSDVDPTWSWGVSHEAAAVIASYVPFTATASDWMSNAPNRPLHYSRLTMIDSGPKPGRGI